MQGVLTAKTDKSAVNTDDGFLFSLIALFVVCGSAVMATLAPISLSIASVFLFAGPHNWMELRYFLSRLPSRFGPLSKFFGTSFAGVILLGAVYAALITTNRAHLLDYSISIGCFQSWISCLYVWLAALIVFRPGDNKAGNSSSFANKSRALTGLALVGGVSIANPLWFGLAMVFLHPLVGLFILDRELQRTRRSWVMPYRITLGTIGIVLLMICSHLYGSASLPVTSMLDQQICRHAGSGLLKSMSSHLLVSLHVFLEMLHYGVWLLAIPIATRAWQKWRLEQIPAAFNPSLPRKLIPVLLGSSTILVLAIWIGFSIDYSHARDIYFTLAIFHVLAELPFLIWLKA